MNSFNCEDPKCIAEVIYSEITIFHYNQVSCLKNKFTKM